MELVIDPNARVAIKHDLGDAGEGLEYDKIATIVEIFETSIEIGFKGFGESCAVPGQGRPVRIEYYEGELRLLVWADITKEDPTHVIVLDGAKEELLDACPKNEKSLLS
jgi:hypothetical protein